MKKRFILSGLTVCLLMAGCQGTQKLQQRDAAMPVPSVTVNRNVQPASPDVYS
ncbi:TPA: pilus assembly protein PilL, partial [Escherichia coli]|nr:pilus assembly protein PilL [Escherichia coli]EKS8317093.1 pilus assembly protein PilL [Escherichia coli]MCF4024278.1 pilus assembly protein PilL [Escherichia coli]HDQ6987956.1 pilus assembly protein PilL [Escherichia coli O113:H21]